MNTIELPVDRYGKIVQMTPTGITLARTVSASLSSSVEITLDTSTTWIRVYAATKDVYLKWGIDNCAESNFDEVIPTAQIVDFEVPNQTDGTRYTALNLIERSASASVVVIEK